MSREHGQRLSGWQRLRTAVALAEVLAVPAGLVGGTSLLLEGCKSDSTSSRGVATAPATAGHSSPERSFAGPIVASPQPANERVVQTFNGGDSSCFPGERDLSFLGQVPWDDNGGNDFNIGDRLDGGRTVLTNVSLKNKSLRSLDVPSSVDSGAVVLTQGDATLIMSTSGQGINVFKKCGTVSTAPPQPPGAV